MTEDSPLHVFGFTCFRFDVRIKNRTKILYFVSIVYTCVSINFLFIRANKM